MKPTWLPEGFRRRTSRFGSEAGGFFRTDSDDPWERHPDLEVHIFTAGTSKEDHHNPLAVHVQPGNATPLEGTETRAGEAVRVSIEQATAVYHDGEWWPGRGQLEQELPDVPGYWFHWNTSRRHSVTVRTADYTIAVGGPKTDRVRKEDLLRVAESTVSA